MGAYPALPSIEDIVHVKRVCQDWCGAAEGLLAEECVLKNLDRDRLRMPFLPHALNADNRVSFMVERVGQGPANLRASLRLRNGDPAAGSAKLRATTKEPGVAGCFTALNKRCT